MRPRASAAGREDNCHGHEIGNGKEAPHRRRHCDPRGCRREAGDPEFESPSPLEKQPLRVRPGVNRYLEVEAQGNGTSLGAFQACSLTRSRFMSSLDHGFETMVTAEGPGPVEFKARQVIITEGELGREMYIIETGKVEIFRGSGEQERRLGLLEAGDFFGEMAILDDIPRGASARAVTDCKLLSIDHSTFDQMLREYPEVAVRMLRKLARRLRMSWVSPEGAAPARSAEALESSPTASGQEATGAAAPQEPIQTEAGPLAKLVAQASGAEFRLPEKKEINLGRFDSVTGIYPDIDLSSVDTNKRTSRRHARIIREGGSVFLFEEIGTPNGTFVNGKRLRTGVKVQLNDGDVIHFADVKTTYRSG